MGQLSARLRVPGERADNPEGLHANVQPASVLQELCGPRPDRAVAAGVRVRPPGNRVQAGLLLCLYCDRWRLGGRESGEGGRESGEGSLPQRTQDVLDEHLRFQRQVYRQEAEAFEGTLSPSQRQAMACLQVLTASKYLEHDCFCLLEAVFAPLRGCYVSETGDSTLESRMDRVMWVVGSWDSALVSHLDVVF